MSLRTSDRCHWCGNPFPLAAVGIRISLLVIALLPAGRFVNRPYDYKPIRPGFGQQKAALVRGGFLPISGESDPETVGERKKVNQQTPVERAFICLS